MTDRPETTTDQTPAIRAAEYARMSTEHQQYSIENQGEDLLPSTDLTAGKIRLAGLQICNRASDWVRILITPAPISSD
jgi:hypothetical protein